MANGFRVLTDLNPLLARSPVVVELGCGPKKKAGSIGVDAIELAGVDVVANLNEGLAFLPDGSVDRIESVHTFEHLSEIETVIREVVRVLKRDGECHITVPHFSNPYYYSDYTHKTPWGLYSMGYFCKEGWPYRRKVPSFYNDVGVRMISQKVRFTSDFVVIKQIRKLVEVVVNSSRLMQELWEGGWCWRVPASELRIVFGKQR
ncbi:MAG: methyltransferase domain-containing protein [Planctomycetes bacterium]|nr:methyltransferase domain-containing protein [Planctomycetota bacterium]